MKSIIIHDFMIKKLKLKGLELLIYAIIFSFSTFGQVCFVSEKTFRSFLNCSRSQFFKVRESLLAKNLISIDISGKGFFTSNTEYLIHHDENLEELIRIAKTPWLD